MSNETVYIAFDIETTGLTVDDEVTTVCFSTPEKVIALAQIQTDTDVSTVRQTLCETTGQDVTVHGFSDEKSLLEGMESSIIQLPDKAVLTGYNASTWRGGFDAPFIRTRSMKHGIKFPIQNIEFTDAEQLIQERGVLNTSVQGTPMDLNKTPLKKFAEFMGVNDISGTKNDIMERIDEVGWTDSDFKYWVQTHHDGDMPMSKTGDLNGVCEIIGVDTPTEYDPFEDSSEAIEAFHNGNITDVLLHNIADVVQTRRLMETVSPTVPDSLIKSQYFK